MVFVDRWLLSQCTFCVDLTACAFKAVFGGRWSLFTVVALARFYCTCFGREPHTWFRPRWTLYIVRLPGAVPWLVGRIHSLVLPFPFSVSESPMNFLAGVVSLVCTLEIRGWKRAKCTEMERVSTHAQGSSLSAWFTYVVWNRTTVLVPKRDPVQRVSAETRTVTPLYSQGRAVTSKSKPMSSVTNFQDCVLIFGTKLTPFYQDWLVWSFCLVLQVCLSNSS